MPAKTQKAFNLWVLLEQARSAIYNARKKELSKYGITPREAATLGAIYSLNNNATPARLARWVYRKPNTVAGILKRMERRGLITLHKDLENKHVIRIGLTDKGQESYKAVRKRQSINKVFNRIIQNNDNELESYLCEIRDLALKQTGDTIHRPFP